MMTPAGKIKDRGEYVSIDVIFTAMTEEQEQRSGLSAGQVTVSLRGEFIGDSCLDASFLTTT